MRLQSDATESLLSEGAGAALEAHLQATKWDLALNPARFASWERLAAGYHFAADSLLVRPAVHPGCGAPWQRIPPSHNACRCMAADVALFDCC